MSLHVGEKHGYSSEKRQGLSTFVRTLALPDPNTLAARPDWSRPHQYLSILAGAICLICEFRTTSTDLLQRHVAKKHGQKAVYGDDNRLPDRTCSSVSLQSWSQQGKRQLWIVVRNDVDLEQTTRPKAAHFSPQRLQRLSEIHDAERARVARRNHAASGVICDDPILASNWMRRTGWAKTFHGIDRSVLLRLVQSPQTTNQYGLFVCQNDAKAVYIHAIDEERLAVLGTAIDAFLDRCEDTVSHTDHSIRCWLRSHDPKRTYKAPFELPARKSTQQRYHHFWKRLIYFCVRVHLLDPEIRDDVLRLPYSKNQEHAARKFWINVSSALDGRDDIVQETQQVEGVRTPRLRSSRNGVMNSAAGNEGHIAEDDASAFDQTDDEETEDDDVESMGSDYAQSSNTADLLDSSDDDASCTSNGSNTTVEHTEHSPSQKHPKDDKLVNAVAELSWFLCKQSFRDGQSSSTLMVYFVSILGISSDASTFERPLNYTPKLSALIHCARLCVLEAVLPRFAYPQLGWTARPSVDQQKILNKARKAYLCNGCQTPVG